MTVRNYGLVSPPDGAEIDFDHPLSRGLALYACFENRPLIYRPDYADSSVVFTQQSGNTPSCRGLVLDGGASDYLTLPGSFYNTQEGTVLCNVIEGQAYNGLGPWFDCDTSRTLIYPFSAAGPIRFYTDAYETTHSSINNWAIGYEHCLAGAYKKTGNYHSMAQNGVVSTITSSIGTWGSNAAGTNFYVSARITVNERHAATWKSFGLWRTAMSPSDLAWISAEPYAIFQYSPRRYYSIVSAASFKAAWARRANVLISPGLK